MELAYRCRDAPIEFDGHVEMADEGACLRIYTGRGRVRVPLHDSYFAEPLAAAIGGLGAGGSAGKRTLRLELSPH